MVYRAYTDGSCKANGTSRAIGAAGFIIVDEHDKIISKECVSYSNTTNNKMEMISMKKALESFRNMLSMEDIPVDSELEVYTDSAYIYNCIKQKWYVNWRKNGWRTSSKEPVKNKELWIRLIPFFEDNRYVFHKVKGHANNSNIHEIWNYYVDNMVQNMAAARMREEKKFEDSNY